DLANKPDLSPADVSRRLNRIAKEADKIQVEAYHAGQKGHSTTRAALAERFAKNLDESLQALARDAAKRGDHTKLNNVLKAFQAGGALHDIKNEFTFHSDSDKDSLLAADRHEQSKPATMYGKPAPMTAADYVKGGLVEPDNPRQHEFGQHLIEKMSVIPDTVINHAQSSEIKHATSSGRPFRGGLNLDFTGDPEVRKQLDRTMNTEKTTKIGGQEVADQFLADVGRASMRLTYAPDKSVDIRQQVKSQNLSGKEPQAQQMATRELKEFAGAMGFSGAEQAIAAKNLSRLMNQDTPGSLHVPANKAIFKDYNALGLMSGKEKVSYEASIDGRGDLIITARKTSPITHFQTDSLGMHSMNPDKQNNANETVTIKVKRDDLAKEPLEYEILSAKTQYDLDTHEATKV
ncbi:MAG: hypothetical protein R3330_10835, partial [Saprospiraceae bacterium]|nr:hypothetical protein [Saprospiraceae bacterium]